MLRACFAVMLIVSGLLFTSQQHLSFFSQPFLTLYNIAAFILVLSIVYLYWLNWTDKYLILAFFQTCLDTVIVTAIIFVTGSYDSIFTFLYLVVIIYSAMLLLQKGGMIIATLSSLQYAALIKLEYYGVITPLRNGTDLSATLDESHIIYRIVIVILACFAVAILSGILSLQLKVAKQDLKITQTHLKRVEKMEAIDEIISGIAHEVKNPLASLSGSIQLLHEDTKPGSYEDKLMQIILRETDRLKDIVNNIRLFSKPRKDRACETVLSEMIEEIVELFSNDPVWSGKVEFSTHLKPDCRVFIDPSHFKQILWNLLTNAAQSIPVSGRVTIRLYRSRNNRVYLTIKDTGQGISSDQARHIFDPFYTTKPDGTGLGLAIIHRLTDTYNGVIDFESTPGKGTLFTIIFPAVDSVKK
ncbi:MAG: ATP-binding protein [Desulfobacterales bacterium]|nr:ATP-binding protein [Desulfobacterales bacterium]